MHSRILGHVCSYPGVTGTIARNLPEPLTSFKDTFKVRAGDHATEEEEVEEPLLLSVIGRPQNPNSFKGLLSSS